MVVISEVGLGRNSTVSAILHDVVRLAHKQLPAEEFLALTADTATASANRSSASQWALRTSPN